MMYIPKMLASQSAKAWSPKQTSKRQVTNNEKNSAHIESPLMWEYKLSSVIELPESSRPQFESPEAGLRM
jgi:hypothetical protein